LLDQEPVRGDLKIKDDEVRVVRRIFEEYIGGKSPRAIAMAFNREAIAGPTGKGWTASTIMGNRKRGTGILNNQLYIGKRVWNRLAYRRDPDTRKRVSKLNPPDQWIVADVPALRIIDQNVWDRAQEMLEVRSRDTRPDTGRGPDWQDRRPKHLFSGLVKCASCGGGMSLVSRIYYGCSARHNKGTCSNRLTMRLDRLEESVLRGLQEQLVTPQLTETFVREYTAEINRIRAEATSSRTATERRLSALNRKIGNIVETVSSGRASDALLDRLETLETEKAGLEAEASLPAPDPVRLHPNIAGLYTEKVGDLRSALNRDDTRTEAATILRGLVDEIRLHPVDGALQIELKGELANLLSFANTSDTAKNKPGPHGGRGCTESLVAGARNHRELTLPPTLI